MSELVPYCEVTDDDIDALLGGKVNLMERFNAGMRAILYRNFANNVSTIYVEDTRVNSAYEYEIPDEGNLEAFEHAFSPLHVNLRPYSQWENDGA